MIPEVLRLSVWQSLRWLPSAPQHQHRHVKAASFQGVFAAARMGECKCATVWSRTPDTLLRCAWCDAGNGEFPVTWPSSKHALVSSAIPSDQLRGHSAMNLHLYRRLPVSASAA